MLVSMCLAAEAVLHYIPIGAGGLTWVIDFTHATFDQTTVPGLEEFVSCASSFCAVLFVDLDRYKQMNDSLGPATEEAVLRHAARRLESVVRESDSVSRFGGDEFVVLLTEVGEPSDAARLAAKMLDALSAPSRIGEHMLHLSASIGIAIFPRDAVDTAGLISRADANMYRAKRNGGGSFAESQGAIGHAARK